MVVPEQPTLQDMEQYLKISMSELDTHLLEQPEVLRQVSDGYALAISRRDEAKEELEQTDAELYSRIREQVEEEGRKATEKTIDAEVKQSSEHQEAHANWLQKKLEADQWSALKDSFHQRSHMLRDLVSLFTSGFFSDPGSVPQEDTKSDTDRINELRREEAAKKRKETA